MPKKTGRPTKSERRQTHIETIKAFAQEHNIEYDTNDPQVEREAFEDFLDMFGLEPKIEDDGKKIVAKRVDENGYVIELTEKYDTISRKMRVQMIRLIRLYERGAPKEPGDLSIIEISSCSERILEHEIGAEWRTSIARIIRMEYTQTMGFSYRYYVINKRLSFKLSEGRLLVSAKLSDNCHYRNGHIIMSKTALPLAGLVGLAGQEVASLMEGEAYGNAFAGVVIERAECPQGTTILHLAEERRLISEPVREQKTQRCNMKENGMKTRIHLVRHGLSESNLSVEVNRRKPDHAIMLADQGHDQAEEAGRFLAETIFRADGMHRRRARFLVSPYLRTRQTADGLEKGFRGYGIEYDRRECLQLREQSFGLFDGLSDDELKLEYPREYAHYEKHALFEGSENGLKGEFFAPMPMGESRARVCDRVRSSFGTILRDCSGDMAPPITDVIVVSHGVTIRCFLREWLHLPWEWCENEKNPNNCSITTIEGVSGRGWKMIPTFAGFDHPHDPAHDKQEHREEGHI